MMKLNKLLKILVNDNILIIFQTQQKKAMKYTFIKKIHYKE